MALSIKANAEDLPSIFQILGLSQPPPVDTSIAGAPPDLPDTSASSQPQSVPTKLGRLQQIIAASQGNTGSPAMTDEHNSPSVPAPGPDTVSGNAPPPSLSQIMSGPQPNDVQFVAAAQGMPPGSVPDASPIAGRNVSQLPGVGEGAPVVTEHHSWAQQHPGLAKILKIGLSAGEGAAAGAGSMTFGEGYARAHEMTDPIRKKIEDATLAEKQAATAHTQATIEQMKRMVRINGVDYPYDLAKRLYPTLVAEEGKNTRNNANIDSRESIAGDKGALAMRKQGLKLDATGKQVPLTRDEMSETEQAHLDLQQSQQEAAAARAELDRNKNNPNSPAYKAAIGRLQVAQKNADTAAGRLGLAKDTFNANYFGTGPDGQALPGAALTENGTPVGVRVSNVTKPTNATRSKAEQAGVIKQQGEDLLNQIDANPDIYGVAAGRWNEFNAGKFGNASQEVRDAYTSLKSFAALQPALHGARGIGMMKEFEDAVGGLGNNPEGLKGSIQSLLRTSTAFQKAGTMKTAPGGGSHPAATHVYDPATGVIAPIKK